MLPLLRFTLDLFEQKLPLAQKTKELEAIIKEAIQQPEPPPAPTQSPAPWRHPGADHEVRLGDSVVAYTLQRSRRRSIGFSVGPDGLEVRAPRWAALRDIQAALQSKAGWIKRKLHEAGDRRALQAKQIINWRDGTQIPYLGQTLTVQLDPTHGSAALICAAPDHLTLVVSLAHSATEQQIRDRVQAWLMQQARGHFVQRLDHFAPQLGVRYTRLGLSNAATRWGSANADGTIRLNWRLMHFSPAVVDYVVVHELSHLRVMNHSPRFWQTVATVLPDYPALRYQLRSELTPTWC